MKKARGKTTASIAGAGLLLVALTAWWCRDDLRAWWVGYRFIWMPDGVIPISVNAAGDAAVNFEPSDSERIAGRWSLAEPGFVPLGTPPGGEASTHAYAINDRGSITGRAFRVGGSREQAFLWSREAGTREVQNLDGERIMPSGLNNRDQVVGWTSGQHWRALVWSPDGGTQDLGALFGGRESQAVAINDRGWVVGSVTTRGSGGVPFIWKPDSGVSELGLTASFSDGSAAGINDRGEVVVNYSKDGPMQGNTTYRIVTPYVWTEEGGFARLPVPPGYEIGHGVAINNRGAVLLWASQNPSMEGAWFLVTDGVLKKLPDAIENGVTYYNDINDLGWIVGRVEPRGNKGKRPTRGFLAKPVW